MVLSTYTMSCDHYYYGVLEHFITLEKTPYTFSSIQLLSHVQLFVTPWTAARQASLPVTNSQSLLKLTSIKSVMPSNHFIFCHPLLSCLQSFPASGSFPMSQFFASGGQYWSFSFSLSPSSEYSGLISFRIDWSDLLAVQGTLKSLLQHHSSKAAILQCSAFLYIKHPVKNPPANAGDVKRTRLDPWVGKITWRRKWQPTPVFLPGRFHGKRSLMGYSPWVCKQLDMTEAT